MPIYENREDRRKQSEAVKILQEKMGHRKLIETPEIYRINHDFTIHNKENLKTGVGEVKCRDYTAEFFEKEPWMFEVERIQSLYNNCEKLGFPVMLVLYTKDKIVFWVALKEVLKVWNELEPAPAHMMTDDHGKKLADKQGVLIPSKMLHRIKI